MHTVAFLAVTREQYPNALVTLPVLAEIQKITNVQHDRLVHAILKYLIH